MRSPISTETTITNVQGIQPRKRLKWKRVLYHPLTWLATGLHVALLVLPFNPAPPVVANLEDKPEETPEETLEEPDEAIPVDLLNLSEIATSEPPPTTPSPKPPPIASLPTPPPPSPASAPPALAPQRAAPIPQPAEPAALPEPEPQTPEPQSTPEPQTPEPQTPEPQTPEPEPQTPEPEPQPAYDPAGDQQLFVQNLGAIGLNPYDLDAIGLPAPKDFKKPVNAPFFLNGDAPVPNAKTVQWLDREPSDVFKQIENSYASTGITFAQEPAYGGEELYHAITSEGQTLMYFSLARLTGSTLLVIWSEKPI